MVVKPHNLPPDSANWGDAIDALDDENARGLAVGNQDIVARFYSLNALVDGLNAQASMVRDNSQNYPTPNTYYAQHSGWSLGAGWNTVAQLIIPGDAGTYVDAYLTGHVYILDDASKMTNSAATRIVFDNQVVAPPTIGINTTGPDGRHFGLASTASAKKVYNISGNYFAQLQVYNNTAQSFPASNSAFGAYVTHYR